MPLTLPGMKRLALGLMLAMLALLVLCAAWQQQWPALAWVRAFAEAAAVGALADWFAVTALFRHPLGLPIPHTAIIPRNKDRIGATLGEFVEQHFLTPQHVMSRLADQRLAAMAADWLANPQQRAQLAADLCRATAWLLERMDDEVARRFLERLLGERLRSVDAAKLAGELLDLLVQRNSHQVLLQHLLGAADGWLGAHRDLIRRQVRAGSRLTPGFFDDYLADRFTDGLLALLHQAATDPAHPVRQQFEQAVQDGLQALRGSPRWSRRGFAAMRWLSLHLRREHCYARLWQDASARLRSDLAASDSSVRRWLEGGLQALARAVAADQEMQRKLDRWTLQALEALLLRHRHQVSRLIGDVVRGWDAADVSAKIEREIGRDLQFIRINGTLVGGAAGLALHAATAALR